MDTQNETEVTAEDYDAALALVLEEHRRWKNGPTGERERGRRLDLCGANLNGADLRGASLRSLRDAVRVSGLQKRDLVCMALCALPQGVRTQVLAHGRGYRRA